MVLCNVSTQSSVLAKYLQFVHLSKYSNVYVYVAPWVSYWYGTAALSLLAPVWKDTVC